MEEATLGQETIPELYHAVTGHPAYRDEYLDLWLSKGAAEWLVSQDLIPSDAFEETIKWKLAEAMGWIEALFAHGEEVSLIRKFSSRRDEGTIDVKLNDGSYYRVTISPLWTPENVEEEEVIKPRNYDKQF
jgi:hypothetical protein